MPYRLLTEFEGLFRGHPYYHRDSSRGDFVAMHLYEDLVSLGRSAKLVDRVAAKECVLNSANRRQGIKARRGDGTFGEIIPGEPVVSDPGYLVSRGSLATVEIGVEVKILAKAMIKQIDRVISDLCGQSRHFKTKSPDALAVGLVGLNVADRYVSFEGSRRYPTGEYGPHPYQEAPEAERRLLASAESCYDEFLILPFRATNEPPFDFRWVREHEIQDRYGALLTRLLRAYARR